MNVPALRFPEFKGEWVATDFGNLVSIGNGQVDPKEEPYASMPHIASDKIESDTGRLLNVRSAKADGVISGKYVFDEHALVYSKIRPNLNKVAFPGYRGICSADMYPLWCVEDVSRSDFLLQLMLDNRFLNQAVAVSMRTGMPKINRPDLNALKVIVPQDTQEQKKIAAFLGVVDAKIAALRARRDGLERYKRGLMQALFSGRLRFTRSDGSAFPDWDEKKADELFRSVSNKDHNGDLPILAVTQEHGAVLRDDIDIDIKSSANSVLSYKIIEVGDFIISLRSFQGGIEYSNILGISSPAYTVLKPSLPIVDGFYKQYFKKEEFISRLSATVVGIRDGKQISYSAFSTMKLLYPHPDEQQKIADALQAMDAKIAAVAGQVAKMEDFKKGLLQQMFV